MLRVMGVILHLGKPHVPQLGMDRDAPLIDGRWTIRNRAEARRREGERACSMLPSFNTALRRSRFNLLVLDDRFHESDQIGTPGASC